MKKITLLPGFLVYVPSLFAFAVRPQFDTNGDIILVSHWPTCGVVTIKSQNRNLNLEASLWNKANNQLLKVTGYGYIPPTGLRVKYDWAGQESWYRIKCRITNPSTWETTSVSCRDHVSLENIEYDSFCFTTSAEYPPLNMNKGK